MTSSTRPARLVMGVGTPALQLKPATEQLPEAVREDLKKSVPKRIPGASIKREVPRQLQHVHQ